MDMVAIQKAWCPIGWGDLDISLYKTAGCLDNLLLNCRKFWKSVTQTWNLIQNVTAWYSGVPQTERKADIAKIDEKELLLSHILPFRNELEFTIDGSKLKKKTG
jgi:hypothetical protein